MLDAASKSDPIRETIDAIKFASRDARLIVAHGTAAAMALMAAAEYQAPKPVLLLSPVGTTKDSMLRRTARSALRSAGGPLLVGVARRKREQLLADVNYLRKQLAFIVRDEAISDDLLSEARDRISDRRTERIIQQSPLLLSAILTPSQMLAHFDGTALFGSAPLDLKVSKRIPGIHLARAWSAPMLDAPEEVARHLRALAG